MKSMPFLIEEVKSPILTTSDPPKIKEINVSLKDVVEAESRLINKFGDDKSQSKVE